ncbi:hypothetical protein EV421DRAFT_1978720 [Armillaria borealis]|uniref:Uncharacterized protein n=1 Tax=Armillaria borealis TaxID=47425 RepID=A0AA39MJD9_9AGAR|nr:hypothetical protein EV421DRAFT_1978720 [Armillaria borealis]
MGISQLDLILSPSLRQFLLLSSLLFKMLNSTEYCLSATPEPYESAPMLESLTSEQYKIFTEERTAMEEKYEEAIGAHEVWKAAKAKEAWLEKLRADKEARAEKLKILQKEEEEWKVAEEKRKEEEKHTAILKEKQEAEEKRKELDRLKVKEVADAAEKKKQDDLKKKKDEKKLEEKGTDVDTKGEMSEGAKKKALKKLKEIRDGKRKATAPVGPKRKRAPKSASVVEESEGGSKPGPSKRVKMEISGPAEGEEMIGNNSAHCFACLASEKSIRGRTCSHCKSKKAACSFNKGTSSALAIGSAEISELLEKLSHTVETLSNKSEEIDSPEDLISDMEEWQASCVELKDLEGWRLDEDIVQLRVKGLAEPEKMNADDPYEVANCEFWYGLRGPEKMVEMKLKRDLFQAMRNEFYKLKGRRSKWQFWKDYLQKHNCDDFMVEDSDPGEKVLNGKVQKSRKPYGKDLGIPALDGLFVLDGDSMGATTSEDEESDESEESESVEDDNDAPVGGTEDVEC